MKERMCVPEINGVLMCSVHYRFTNIDFLLCTILPLGRFYKSMCLERRTNLISGKFLCPQIKVSNFNS